MTAGDITSALSILMSAISTMISSLSSTFPFNIIFGAVVGICAIALIGGIVGIFHKKG